MRPPQIRRICTEGGTPGVIWKNLHSSAAAFFWTIGWKPMLRGVGILPMIWSHLILKTWYQGIVGPGFSDFLEAGHPQWPPHPEEVFWRDFRNARATR
jgi:hypothetical protein